MWADNAGILTIGAFQLGTFTNDMDRPATHHGRVVSQLAVLVANASEPQDAGGGVSRRGVVLRRPLW